MRYFTGILLFISLAGCGREASFLYRVEDRPLEQYEAVHSLKQLQGQRKVDILWVVDNSPSMSSHHANLIKNFDSFIAEFVAKGGLEWKMGLLSTAIAENPYAGFTSTTPLNYRMPDVVQKFQDAVRKLGLGGDGTERSFAPIKKQLALNPTFLRKEATLAIIFITDAAEQSQMSGKELLNYLASLKGDAKKVIGYGALTPVDFSCPPSGEDRWNYAGSTFEEFIAGTKGKVYKLCDDFGKNLADLGKDLITRVERPHISLPDRPNTSTIRVTYKGKILPGGSAEDGGFWIYDFDLNRIVFHNLNFAPGDTEEVAVTYSR